MKDYLNEFCYVLDITLIYIESKRTIISCGIEGTVPYIKIDNLFICCPYEISKAVIGYCIDVYDREKYSEVLRDFIRRNSKKMRYEFGLPSKKFTSCMLKKLIHISADSRIIPSNREMDIIKIKGKSFCSNEFSVIDNNFSILDDDLLELEIIVSPFDT